MLTATAVVGIVVYLGIVITHSSAVDPPQLISSGNDGLGHGIAIDQAIRIDVSALYLIPIALSGLTGLLLLLWPTRKPPRLTK